MRTDIRRLILSGMIVIPMGLCGSDNSVPGNKDTKGMPIRIPRPLTLQTVLKVTTGKSTTNTLPSTSDATRVSPVIPLQTNTTARAAETQKKIRRTRGGNGTRFIDIDGDGISDDRDL